MYDNDYSVSLMAVAAWLSIAALVGGGISFMRDSRLRDRLLTWWYLFPAVAMTILCAVLYVVLPDDRYMSPVGGHWLIMLSVAIILGVMLTPPWALAAWAAAKLVRRYKHDTTRTSIS